MITVPRHLHSRALEAADAFYHSFGKNFDQYLTIERSRSLDVAFDDAYDLVMFSRAPELIRQWREETMLHRRRGPKPTIDEVAILILMLVQLRTTSDMRWNKLADTMRHLSDEQRDRLGVPNRVDEWYHRLRRGYSRLEEMIDAFPGPRHHTPKASEYRELRRNRRERADELARRADRFRELVEALIEATIQRVPREIRRRWRGNTAQDATKFLMLGKRGNPLVHDEESDRTTINYDAGPYSRAGKHDGEQSMASGKSTEHALEAEIAVMLGNAPGEESDFPRLVLGYDFHRPGKIKGAAFRMIESIARRGHPGDHYIVDRAYSPYTGKELFQLLFTHGYEPVHDYKKGDTGKKAAVATSRKKFMDPVLVKELNTHLIIVGGGIYLSFMPEEQQRAELNYLEAKAAIRANSKLTAAEKADMKAAAKERRNQLLAAREVYRLKRRGGRRPDGSQQYSFPDPAGYGLGYDERTGEVIEPPTKKTIVIPFEVESKWVQKYPHKSPEWRAYYGMRNAIESVNKMIKGSTSEDTQVAIKRAARGNTFSALVVGLACVSLNLRKILNFYRSRLAKREVTSQNRLSYSTYLTADQLRQLRAMYPNRAELAPLPLKVEVAPPPQVE